MAIDYLAFGYAATVAAGGVLGYVKAGSMVSLIMGLLSGSVLGVGAYQVSQNPKNLYLSLGTSAVLAGIMGMRYMKSGKVMPAGLVAGISLLFVVRYGVRALGVATTRTE